MAYGVEDTPTLVLMDKQGKIIQRTATLEEIEKNKSK